MGLVLRTAIGLLTDFGTSDPFVGEMKAVIFSICPDVELIDITHEVERFNIRMGAFLLSSATPYFPPGSVHLAIVDPGVGSSRRAIAVETVRATYVGPDNGLLTAAALREGIRHVYEITNPSLMRETVSSTFHGRDIFAPVAAHLAAGTGVQEVGKEIVDFVMLALGNPEFHKRGAECEVIHVDKFGNVITNIRHEDLDRIGGRQSIVVHGRRFRARMVRSYSELSEKELGFLIGSHGFLEYVCREDSAARRIRARSGDVIRITVT
jgi:S-adenosylmethionine hydrolase